MLHPETGRGRPLPLPATVGDPSGRRRIMTAAELGYRGHVSSSDRPSLMPALSPPNPSRIRYGRCRSPARQEALPYSPMGRRRAPMGDERPDDEHTEGDDQEEAVATPVPSTSWIHPRVVLSNVKGRYEAGSYERGQWSGLPSGSTGLVQGIGTGSIVIHPVGAPADRKSRLVSSTPPRVSAGVLDRRARSGVMVRTVCLPSAGGAQQDGCRVRFGLTRARTASPETG